MLLFRHEKPRKYQDEIITDVILALEKRNNLLIHAPTGLGKTDAVLSPSITKAIEENLTIFFLTPKITQHKIALEVIKGINEKYGLKLRSCDIIGRRYSCLFSNLSKLDNDNFYSACERLRKEELCMYHRRAIGYSYEEAIEADEIMRKVKIIYNNPSHIDMINFGLENDVCPYEIMLKLTKDAMLIIADYYHFFIPSIRETLLKKAKKDLSKCIVIVDESHNLPNRLRSYLSKSFNSIIARKAEKEIKEIINEKLEIEKILDEIADEVKIKENEELEISKEMLIKHLPKSFDEMISLLTFVGNEYIKRHGKNSACIRIATFLSLWQENDEAIRIIKRHEKGLSIVKKSLDCSVLTRVLNETYAYILMSATMKPFDMYKDILALENVETKSYESPFPKNNKLVLIAKGFTSKYKERKKEMYEKYAKALDALFSISPGNVMVFFPSFEFLENTKEFMLSYPLLTQKKDAKPKDNVLLLELFKAEKSMLLAVQGGSLAEGYDFSNEEIKILVIAGFGLDEMTLETKALVNYYEKKFGKGIAYAYIYPAIIKAVQAAGRAIRKESDKAAIIFMDDRFSYYKKMLNEDVIETYDYLSLVKKFFNQQCSNEEN